MIILKKYRWFLILLTCISCTEDSEKFAVEPVIEFASVSFGETPELSEFDTLSVTFSFKDDDDDLGFDPRLPSSDTLFPYHPWILFLKATGELIPSEDLFTGRVALEDVIRLSDRQSPPYDTLPDRSNGCYNLGSYVRGLRDDPPYSIPNENRYNLLIDFLYEDSGGNFVEFDFYKELCTTFNGRFVNAIGEDGPFIMKMNSATTGQLTYRMLSIGFIRLFGDKKMKLRIFVKDKALHNSNVIETPTFFLSDI